MPTKGRWRATVNLRPYEDEISRWREAAALAGLSLHGWCKRVVNESAAAEIALARESARRVDERERLRRIAFPQEGAS